MYWYITISIGIKWLSGIKWLIPLNLEWPLTPISRLRRFSTLNISETTRDRAIVTIVRQQEVICALLHGDISNDLDGPLTRFSRSRHFWSRLKTARVLKTKLLLHSRKLYLAYGMVQCLVTLTDLQTRRAGLSASAELLVPLVKGATLCTVDRLRSTYKRAAPLINFY